MDKISRSSTFIVLAVSFLILTVSGQTSQAIFETQTQTSKTNVFDYQLNKGQENLTAQTQNLQILRASGNNPIDFNELNYPGYDTLFWHDYSPSSNGYTIRGYQAGFGILLTPEHYPAVIAGVHHRVFRLNSDSLQIRFVDDDGPSGAPLSTLFKFDTVTTSYTTSFIYHAIPPPACTIWDGKFYLFMLGNTHNNTIFLLNWLRDPAINAPTGYHWQHDTLGIYTAWSPAGDLEMGAVVEYHDVKLDTVNGLPANDTVFIDSTYAIRIWCREMAGFSESNVPVIFHIAGVYSDTGYLSFTPYEIDSAILNWTVNLPEGSYSCTCYTALISDSRINNDELIFNIRVTLGAAIAGQPNQEKDFKLVIAPNPADNVTKIYYALPKPGAVLMELFNVSGALVKSQRIMNPTKEGVFLLNKLSAGVYFLRFNSGDIRVTRKIVLEK